MIVNANTANMKHLSEPEEIPGLPGIVPPEGARVPFPYCVFSRDENNIFV